jgi:hypothetical protein
MSQLDGVRSTSAPPLTGAARGLIRWVCTSNPFYVLSAGLFLAGLRLSFGAQAEDVETWELMSGLAGYTLLLAATAFLLVRWARVWDDVRTVLLLVVLMFLATSVTFDEALILSPGRGFVCYLGGLLFAMVVSEGLLRGLRLRLPLCFRLPYHLILALFFLYPLAVSPLVTQPHDEALLWALFGFSTVAGLVFLTLLPAVWCGAETVRENGSPWRWPFYPWALFSILALAVPGRAVLMCWSMHLIRELDQLMFGPYFLIPFGLSLTVLTLEFGLVTRRQRYLALALAAPVGLIVLALVGHRSDPIYQEFLQRFTSRLGGDPLYLTLLSAAGFYVYAMLRRVVAAADALTLVLLALAVIGPRTFLQRELVGPQPMPILAAAMVQLGLGLRHGKAWRCLLASSGLMTGALLLLPKEMATSHLLVPLAFHLMLLAVLIVGAAFNDRVGRLLRIVGAILVLVESLAVLFGWRRTFADVSPWLLSVYPLAMGVALAGYGRLLSHQTSRLVAALIVVLWTAVTGWRSYISLREVVIGLDHMALSLVLFALAILVSLAKSGTLTRWIVERRLRIVTVEEFNGCQATEGRADDPPGPRD